MKLIMTRDRSLEKPCQELRDRYARRQADLKAQFKFELEQVPRDDILMYMRVRHKYRELGLNV